MKHTCINLNYRFFFHVCPLIMIALVSVVLLSSGTKDVFSHESS